jgi:hypothetical protein
MITLTKEQWHRLTFAITLAQYHVDDMEPSDSCYEDDKETLLQAEEVIQEVETAMLAEYTTPKFEPAQEEV